jgi:hypothetical protein
MAEATVRRKRTFYFFTLLGLAGSALLFFSGQPQLGLALLIGCWFFTWYAKRGTGAAAPLQFDPRQPFTPDALVELKLNDAPRQGERRTVIAVGPQGFSARFIAPAAAQARAPLRVEAQFLRPEVALRHLPAGTAFSVIDGQRIVGSGEVIEVRGAR